MCEVAYIWEMVLNKILYHCLLSQKNLYRTRNNCVSAFCTTSMHCHLLISSLINPHCGYRWINSDLVCSDSRHWSWYECQGNSEGFVWLHNAVINYINTEALSWLLAGERTQGSYNFDVINTSWKKKCVDVILKVRYPALYELGGVKFKCMCSLKCIYYALLVAPMISFLYIKLST